VTYSKIAETGVLTFKFVDVENSISLILGLIAIWFELNAPY